MARFYSAIKMEMGLWKYYVVRMRMGDIASEIKFARDLNDDKTLDEEIQRDLDESRSSRQIVRYLQTSDYRFFNSIVVAALGGNPEWVPVSITDNPEFKYIPKDNTECFGMLVFDESLKTFALDGQHRLSAIKQLIDGQAETPPPAGFSAETIGVTFVVPPTDMEPEEFRKGYRRLFSALNRHAKPTGTNINIIMDEDDRFAILTRRLIHDMEFFQWSSIDGGTPKIDAKRISESLSSNSNSFATIVGLYKINTRLLWTRETINDHGNPLIGNGYKELIQTTPDDEELETLYEGLEKIWDAILVTLPELLEEPVSKRRHGTEGADSLLFWPIGQTELLAPLVRRLLNAANIDIPSSGAAVVEALKPLALIPWDLQHDIWRNLLIIQRP